MTPDVRTIAAFVALMQGGEGLASKSPAYLLEKWETVANAKSFELAEAHLDSTNHARLDSWLSYWIAEER